MQYYLVERQSGGCDYTIGCGLRITHLRDAKTLEDAKSQANNKIGDNWHADHEVAVDSAEILEVNEVVDLAPFLTEKAAERKQRQAEEDAEEAAAAERAEYERLRKKFG